MTYQQYREYVKEHVKDYLPAEYAEGEVCVEKSIKNNGKELYGLSVILPDKSVFNRVYLEESYLKYLNGEGLDGIMKNVAAQYDREFKRGCSTEIPKLESVFKDFSFEKLKDKIFPKVINQEMNPELLQKVPHKEIHDLAVVYHILIADGQSTGAAIINNQHLDHWGIDEETLERTAKENMMEKFPPELHSMDYIINQLMGMPEEYQQEGFGEKEMYVLSNREGIYGASYLDFPEVLEEAGEKLQGSFVIIPSSLHELMLVKESEATMMDELAGVLKEANEEVVEPSDLLSDSLYFYDRERKEITMYEPDGPQMGMDMKL